MYSTSSVVLMVTHQQSRITPGQGVNDDVRNTVQYLLVVREQPIRCGRRHERFVH